jgi:MFS family permease
MRVCYVADAIHHQFCGVNVIAYYSTIILLRAGSEPTKALWASFGFGVINFVFALPAFWTIDTFGRRSLLLATFPFMAVCHALISIAFGVTDSDQKSSDIRIGLTIASMYLFGIAYSPGEGPVPFV